MADRDIQRGAKPYANYLIEQFKSFGGIKRPDAIYDVAEIGLASLINVKIREAIVDALSDGYLSAQEMRSTLQWAQWVDPEDAFTKATLEHIRSHQPIFERMNYIQHLMGNDCTLPSHKLFMPCTSTDDIAGFRKEVRQRLQPTLVQISEVDPNQNIRHKAIELLDSDTPKIAAEPKVVLYGRR